MNKFTNTKNINNFPSTSFDWMQIQNEMKNKLGLEIYESWLKKISFVEEFNNYVLLIVPTRFIRDWITSRYLDQILQIIKSFKKDNEIFKYLKKKELEIKIETLSTSIKKLEKIHKKNKKNDDLQLHNQQFL